jgi:hypothetical protein
VVRLVVVSRGVSVDVAAAEDAVAAQAQPILPRVPTVCTAALQQGRCDSRQRLVQYHDRCAAKEEGWWRTIHYEIRRQGVDVRLDVRTVPLGFAER